MGNKRGQMTMGLKIAMALMITFILIVTMMFIFKSVVDRGFK